MSRPVKRKRGGQPGNQNARKHGFYSICLSPPEICELWKILNLGGADREIAVLRIKLSSALRSAPGNRRVIREASRLLAKWYRSKYRLVGADNTEFKKIVRNILADAGKYFAGTNRSSLDGKCAEMPERIEAENMKQSPLQLQNKQFKKTTFLQNESPLEYLLPLTLSPCGRGIKGEGEIL